MSSKWIDVSAPPQATSLSYAACEYYRIRGSRTSPMKNTHTVCRTHRTQQRSKAISFIPLSLRTHPGTCHWHVMVNSDPTHRLNKIKLIRARSVKLKHTAKGKGGRSFLCGVADRKINHLNHLLYHPCSEISGK